MRCLVLLSMTGFGNATGQNDRFSASVEIKAVNNRYLKISQKFPDVLAPLEPRIEKVVRGSVARGTVNVQIQFASIGQASRFWVIPEVLQAYWQQLQDVDSQQAVPAPSSAADLLALPGVIADELALTVDIEQEWSLVEETLNSGLQKLRAFRQLEGDSMRNDLQQNCQMILSHLERVAEQAPAVVSGYRDKILERVRELLAETGVKVEPENLIREVSVFSDRCDINEEITRLRCHIDQFGQVVAADTSQGRKLDFLTQEMFREINTIGSKANDVQIAHHVVEMKSAAEKMREIIQNVE